MNTEGVYFAYVGEKKPLDGLRRFFCDIIMCIKFGDDRLRGLQLVGVKLLAFSDRLCWLPLQHSQTTACEPWTGGVVSWKLLVSRQAVTG